MANEVRILILDDPAELEKPQLPQFRSTQLDSSSLSIDALAAVAAALAPVPDPRTNCGSAQQAPTLAPALAPAPAAAAAAAAAPAEPYNKRKSGFHLSNISSIGQGFSSFADGFMGGSEMGAQDRVDAAYQDDNKKTRGYQRKPGESAYHYVT